MRRLLMTLALAGLLAGCSSTSKDLEQKPSAASAERTYSENYQEIYRRVYDGASRCLAASNSATQSLVEAQLYNELGYGEITHSLSSVYGRNFYLKITVAKEGDGAKLSVHSGNTLVQQQRLNDVLRWAEGDQRC